MRDFTPAATAIGVLVVAAVSSAPADDHIFKIESWTIDTAEQWQRAAADTQAMTLEAGQAKPTADQAHFQSRLRRFADKRKLNRITFTQTASWPQWQPVDGIAPKNTRNAPVFLPVKENEYWYFAERGGRYHAFHTSDMKNWTHHGEVAPSKWVTTAEYADGKVYIYYDKPNDQDPHLVVHEDLTDNNQRSNKGEVFADPSHGSDAGILRSSDGIFHLIYEDWTPIDARRHSWDSPLAGHADSEDGVHGFEPHEQTAPIDERTVPQPDFGRYDHSSRDHGLFYHKHKPEQDAYGDFTLVQIGQRYYIFCDYDPHNGPMGIGYWSSDDINGRFDWQGTIDRGFHPDPTIGFANGRFYLLVQRNDQDYVSQGPWVETVRVRAGVDTDGDDKVDQWTDWQTVRETYHRKEGFARVVETDPAAIDLSNLPAARGVRFEFKVNAPDQSDDGAGEANPKPTMDQVRIEFQ